MFSLRLLLRSTKLESVAPLRPVVPEIMFMGSSSFIFRRWWIRRTAMRCWSANALRDADVPVVAGVGIAFIPGRTDALEGVDDYQPSGRMLPEELLHLFHQSGVELLGHHGEVQGGRRVLREIQQSALDALEAVLQAEIEGLRRILWRSSRGVLPCHLEAQPQCQPRLAGLGRSPPAGGDPGAAGFPR